MDESFKDRLFREPEGRSQGFVWISVALIFFTLYLYYSGSNESRATLGFVLGVVFVLVSLPEFLPAEHRYAAGLLRVVSMLFAVLALAFGVLSF